MDAVGYFCLMVILPTVMVFPEAHISECQNHVNLSSITAFQSPNYPFQYPPNICILWFYSGRAGSEFVLRFFDMDLPGKMGACSQRNDILMIGPAEKSNFCGRIGKLFSLEYRVRLTPQSNTVYVMFNSTSNPRKGRGFHAEYSITPMVTKTGWLHTDIHQDSNLTTHSRSWNTQEIHKCDYFLTSTASGCIPERAINFRRTSECHGSLTWLVVAPKPKIPFTNAAITFEVALRSCPKQLMNTQDLLEVFDGRNASMPLLIRCSTYGRNVIGTHSTHSDSFFVRYKLGPSSLQNLYSLRFRRKAQCFEGFDSCGNEDTCYHPSGRCNGSWECPLQGRDELNCGSATPCPLGKYSCDMNNLHCYEEKDRCNGKGTCTNYKDEMNCDPSICNQGNGLFLCSNSRCIYEKWHCDGTSDCADGSDESGCGSLMTPRVLVAAVVGSLICSLLMVVALGCACKVYRLRQFQLSGSARPTDSCCEAHGRHNSPLTRQLAEMFRQRAPPPPYHEAMLTSRPYHEMLRELEDEGQHATSIEDARGLGRDRAGLFRPLRRRESEPSSSRVVCSSQRSSGRRSRGRRQHREVNQNDPSFQITESRNPGFIEVGSLTLLGSGPDQEEGTQAGGINPPPYSMSDPGNTGSLDAMDAAGSSSGENNSEVSDDDAVDREEEMLLSRQRKGRRSRSRALERRSAGPCMEMSQVTRTRDNRVHVSGSESVHLQRSMVLTGERDGDNCDRIDEERCKRGNEFPHTSLSLSSSHRLEPSMSFQSASQGFEHVVGLVDEESDSDCILLGEEDTDDKEKDNMDEKDKEIDPTFEEDSDDSDTACLLSAV
ncbi:hypothetical protein EGW08_016311 [Elysia chlorotica]|uniref:CUB domain-containing protein n=1 Tax=Elysia chlorotica TaxID=188477 RepID=A0A3S1B4M1_ELYCH|nr:hypothetical protein EGW08_016311 [Elysia chlorotica]